MMQYSHCHSFSGLVTGGLVFIRHRHGAAVAQCCNEWSFGEGQQREVARVRASVLAVDVDDDPLVRDDA